MPPLPLSMSVLTVVVTALIATGFARVSARAGVVAAIVLVGILGVQWQLADTGRFLEWGRMPPPLVPVVAGMVILAALVAFSPIGRRLIAVLPLWALVGFQAFRFPLELVMHRAAVDGIMPVQMSYSGWNFDILTGVSAIVVAALAGAGRAPAWIVMLWNVVGSILLITIMTIAIASTPTFAAFGDDRLNTWIADPPYVWLPGLLVPAAAFGHLLLWRRTVQRRTGGEIAT